MVDFSISQNNLHIVDSYKVSKRDFKKDLKQIRTFSPDSDVWKRSMCSMKKEWASHNALYALHLFRSHTKDVDINYPLKWYMSVAYAVFGTLVWPFIK